jgi:hypothetical protein
MRFNTLIRCQSVPIQPLRAQYHNGLVHHCARLLASSSHVHAGAPVLSCVYKGVPDIFMDCHMMVAQPEKVSACLIDVAVTDVGICLSG